LNLLVIFKGYAADNFGYFKARCLQLDRWSQQVYFSQAIAVHPLSAEAV
jgi:hypothetical protein